MPKSRDANDVLNRDFLELRCRILEIAAGLDRLDRAPRSSIETSDSRIAMLRRGIESLLEPVPSRAETVQRLFSLEYDSDWRTRFEI